MQKIKLIGLFILIAPLIGCKSSDNKYIDVASYVDTTGKVACSDKIQELINNNPNRTLYFRDGTYLLNHQILTPGHPEKSVDLQLSNYAILKASDDYQVKRTEEIKAEEKWKDEYLYMVSLGGLDRTKDGPNLPTKPGSNYSLTGGIIDGNGRAAGVEIAGGRETRIQNVTMKNVQIGIYIGFGANNGSSDADIFNVDISCNDAVDSYGLKLKGSDNSVTNARLNRVTHGVLTTGGTNILRNVHPLHNGEALNQHYNESIGFEINSFTQLNNCYSDNFRIAFKLNNNRSFITDCIAWWFNAGGEHHEQYCIYRESDEFNASITNFVAGFRKKDKSPITAKIMNAKDETKKLGDGFIQNIRANLLDQIIDVNKDGDVYKPATDSLLKEYCRDEAIHKY